MTRTPVRELERRRRSMGRDAGTDERRVRARAIVNAAGPWVGDVARLVSGPRHASPPTVRLVKGSHIVVPRITGADDAYTFQNRDGRVVFALPFEEDFTLIGTTEAAPVRQARAQRVSRRKRKLICSTSPIAYFRAAADARMTSSGALPAFGRSTMMAVKARQPSAAITGSSFEAGTTPPILHVIGGKITTYRKLAEAALKLLEPHLVPMRQGTTATTPLPGGDFDGRPSTHGSTTSLGAISGFNQGLSSPPRAPIRNARVADHRRGNDQNGDLGEDFGAGLSAREIAYLKAEEWARTADDILWRRTKAGLHLAPDERQRAEDRIEAYLGKV